MKALARKANKNTGKALAHKSTIERIFAARTGQIRKTARIDAVADEIGDLLSGTARLPQSSTRTVLKSIFTCFAQTTHHSKITDSHNEARATANFR